MAQLDIVEFSGGKNNSLEPHLLKSNEAQELLNVTLDRRSISAGRDKIKISDPMKPELTLQNGSRSIVASGGHHYWVDNDTGDSGSTEGFFGITPPNQAIQATPGLSGERFLGEYQYIGRFAVDRRVRGAPYLPSDRDSLVTTVIARQNAKTLSLLEYPSFSFGIPQPFDASLLVGFVTKRYPAGNIVNHLGRTWRARTNVEFKFDGLGTKNAINAFAEPILSSQLWEDITNTTIEVTGFNSITLSKFPRPVENGVPFFEIYRTTADGADFFLLDSLELGEPVYEDFVTDAEIVNREVLTQENAFPPVYEIRGSSWERSTGKFLTKVDNRFWLAVRNLAYHSTSNSIHSYNPSHVIDFEGEITAMWEMDGGLLVWPKDKPLTYTVGNIENLSSRTIKFATTQDNPNWRTTANVFKAPVWQSHEGISTISKGPLGVGFTAVLLTEEKYNFPSIGNFALGFKGQYFLFFDEKTVVFDFTNNHLYDLELVADYGWVSENDESMYLVHRNQIYKYPGDKFGEFVYKSPEWHMDGGKIPLLFDRLEVTSELPFKYAVKYEDTWVITEKQAKSKFISLPDTRAESITVELKLTNALKGYKIVYGEA